MKRSYRQTFDKGSRSGSWFFWPCWSFWLPRRQRTASAPLNQSSSTPVAARPAIATSRFTSMTPSSPRKWLRRSAAAACIYCFAMTPTCVWAQRARLPWTNSSATRIPRLASLWQQCAGQPERCGPQRPGSGRRGYQLYIRCWRRQQLIGPIIPMLLGLL